MIDHVELLVADAAQSTLFFAGALAPLGYALHVQGASNGFGSSMEALDFWLKPGGPSAPRPHVAFNCSDRATVDAAYAAALASGGRENGAPALLERIHPNYYAGFVQDPDGHNIEFVCHRAG
ncbi:catechol 2,3-dioxygenase-like lactoylglutathione lyase family enzyme [Tahibacter aquaticus]|uniref:Catechol 2,3-dioxygenase-like lactoylglutathione lyase family enzyme n=1 Tax=Tahibacter aquaticus TaxID=520092 RepID=A0A4R6YV95_9GAMM|nr:VOC family protein [Tahibacter aquaticus]TDR42565.1 catechol 2,3-dioxygenase-like lactoylglutathione lyase family enzyme [Tahibacter aquaticus]